MRDPIPQARICSDADKENGEGSEKQVAGGMAKGSTGAYFWKREGSRCVLALFRYFSVLM